MDALEHGNKKIEAKYEYLKAKNKNNENLVSTYQVKLKVYEKVKG